MLHGALVCGANGSPENSANRSRAELSGQAKRHLCLVIRALRGKQEDKTGDREVAGIPVANSFGLWTCAGYKINIS